MERMQRLTQAYFQAPWRRQLQVIGTVLLILVCFAIIAGIYLNVTSRAATLGRQTQDLQIRMEGMPRMDVPDDPQADPQDMPIEELRIDIADLEAKLAALTANSVMRQRAENLGYHPATAENIVYIEVEGYVSRQTAVLANPLPAQPQNTQIILADAYRQSLIDWIQEEWVRLSHLIKEVQP